MATSWKYINLDDFKNDSEILAAKLSYFSLSIHYRHFEEKGEEYHLNQFNSIIDELYFKSLKDNHYWQFCPSKVYIDTFEVRCAQFLENNPESEKLNFLYEEKEEILRSYQEQKSVRQPDGTYSIYQEEQIQYQLYLKDKGIGLESFLPVYISLANLDERTKSNIKKAQKKKLEFIDSKLLELRGVEIVQKQHRNIFINTTSFELFCHLQEKMGVRHLDISFIYRTMFDDGFIHQQSESLFRFWLEKLEPHYPKFKSKLQSRNHAQTKKRIAIYLQALDQYQLKSKTYS